MTGVQTCALPILIYTFVIYFVFVLSTKLNQNVLYVSLTLLLLFFIKEYYNNKKINLIIKDENIDGMIKETKIKKIEKENFMLNVIYGLIVIGGALLYDDKKYKIVYLIYLSILSIFIFKDNILVSTLYYIFANIMSYISKKYVILDIIIKNNYKIFSLYK